MRTDFRVSSLVPSGLAFDGVSDSSDLIILAVRSETITAECPLCGTAARRIHSRYTRQLADLPSAGRRLQLRLITRRFRCEVPHCRRRIFAERFGEKIVPLRARRTSRLEYIVHHLGLALGGRPAASLAKRLMLPVSNDTLLRVVRRRTAAPTDPLLVVGIDDWAFRRNHRYGTIVCDLERRRIVTLLPDREMATVQAWLAEHPEIKIVSRDRGGGYGEAAAKALPEAIQVADRWHLMENASAAFLDAVRRSMRGIRTAIGATTINPALLTARKSYDIRVIYGARMPTRQLPPWLEMACPSRKSPGGRATAATMSAASIAAQARMCSERGRAPWMNTSHSWTPNGAAAAAMAPSSGAA
jgi:transposase